MPVPGPNAKSIVFGHFGFGYVARQARGNLTVQRLEERYGDALQVGYEVHGSFDGRPNDSAALALYRNAAA
jgi:HK97 family phage major capsid protein